MGLGPGERGRPAFFPSMVAIDWSKIYEATSKDDRPTPGYLFHEIVHNVSLVELRDIPAVAEYLADCVDGDHAHVKLKALFVIKTLAYRVPPFCRDFQERIASIQQAASFTGPPSPIFGDEPYRLVRDAAAAALAALTSGEHYHEQYREMSQRIVGFGNFQPPEEIVLPDGSIDVAPTVSGRDIAKGAVSAVLGGIGAVLGGVRGAFSAPFSKENEINIDAGEPDDYGFDGAEEEAYDDEPLEDYEQSGTYVPPVLSAHEDRVEEEPTLPAAEKEQDLLFGTEGGSAVGFGWGLEEEDPYAPTPSLDEAIAKLEREMLRPDDEEVVCGAALSASASGPQPPPRPEAGGSEPWTSGPPEPVVLDASGPGRSLLEILESTPPVLLEAGDTDKSLLEVLGIDPSAAATGGEGQTPRPEVLGLDPLAAAVGSEAPENSVSGLG